jgi:hypothetical protein
MRLYESWTSPGGCWVQETKVNSRRNIHEGGWVQSWRNRASELVILNVPGKRKFMSPCQLVFLVRSHGSGSLSNLFAPWSLLSPP